MIGWGFGQGGSGGGNPWLQQLSQRLAAWRSGMGAQHPQWGQGQGWGGWQGGQPGGTPPIIPQQNGFAAGGGGGGGMGGGMGMGMGWGREANGYAAPSAGAQGAAPRQPRQNGASDNDEDDNS